MDQKLAKVIKAAREATCDTHNIPACVELGRALYEYDKARGAICPTCDGAGSIDGEEDEPGEGPTCTGPCGGTGLVEPSASRVMRERIERLAADGHVYRVDPNDPRKFLANVVCVCCDSANLEPAVDSKFGDHHCRECGLTFAAERGRSRGLGTCAFCTQPAVMVASVGCGEQLTSVPRCERHARTCEQCRYEEPDE